MPERAALLSKFRIAVELRLEPTAIVPLSAKGPVILSVLPGWIVTKALLVRLSSVPLLKASKPTVNDPLIVPPEIIAEPLRSTMVTTPPEVRNCPLDPCVTVMPLICSLPLLVASNKPLLVIALVWSTSFAPPELVALIVPLLVSAALIEPRPLMVWPAACVRAPLSSPPFSTTLPAPDTTALLTTFRNAAPLPVLVPTVIVLLFVRLQ